MSRWPVVLTAVVVLATLSLGTLIKNELPQPDHIRQRPYLRQAAIQTPIYLRTGSVEVLSVDASSRITDQWASAISQNGTFLVVTLKFTANNQPESVANLSIEAADGRSFGGNPPLGTNLCGISQPGIPLRCQVIFEIDKAALPGAKLRIPATIMTDGAGDDVALVDLGLDQKKATALARRSQPLNFISFAVAGTEGAGR